MRIEEALVYFRKGHRIRLLFPYVNEASGYMTMMDIIDPKERKSFIITDLGFLSNAWEVEFDASNNPDLWSKEVPSTIIIDKGYTTSKSTGVWSNGVPKTDCGGKTWGSYDWKFTERLVTKSPVSSLGLDPM